MNAYTVRRFNDNYYEIVVMKKELGGFKAREINTNDEKLDNNLARARTRAFELAMCNEFTHFYTGTLSKEKVDDRFDLDSAYRPISQFYRDIGRKKYNSKIKYLNFPEPHKDGAWHFHGLMAGIPEEHITEFPKHAPLYLRENGYKNWLDYADRFGWCSLAPIKDTLAVSKYITKYITKAIVSEQIRERVGKHVFYHSRPLQGAQVIKKGTMLGGTVPDSHLQYENDYILKYAVTAEEIGTILERLYQIGQ